MPHLGSITAEFVADIAFASRPKLGMALDRVGD
jgi:hypothetical protein